MTLKRGLTRLEGVADAKLIVKPGHMEVTMKPGYWPDFSKMEETIKRAGYHPVPEQIELLLTGTLVKVGEGYVVDLDGMKAPVRLGVAAPARDPARLAEHAGKAVTLQGRWQPAASGQPEAGTLVLSADPAESGPTR